MRKHIEEFWCDRCKSQYERQPRPFRGAHYTMEIGWFLLNNGSGSKYSTPQDRRNNLDYDLCESCTTGFLTWWRDVEQESNE